MDRNEFRFLESDAERVGREGPLPHVERVFFDSSSGRRVSALNFRESEDSISAPIVFLHGAGLNAHSFGPTILALRSSSLALDLPGHGRSDWRADGVYAPSLLAADVAETISSFSDAPVHLVGHSLGGLTGSAVLDIAPETVLSLTIIDITAGVKPAKDAGAISEFISGQKTYDSVAEIVDRAIKFGIGSDRESLTRGVFLNTRVREDGKLEWTHHLAHLDGLASASENSAERVYDALWDPLLNAAVPVRLVRGSAGMVSDALLAQWEEKLPGSQRATLEGGHNLHEHNPVGLANLLRDWLR